MVNVSKHLHEILDTYIKLIQVQNYLIFSSLISVLNFPLLKEGLRQPPDQLTPVVKNLKNLCQHILLLFAFVVNFLQIFIQYHKISSIPHICQYSRHPHFDISDLVHSQSPCNTHWKEVHIHHQNTRVQVCRRRTSLHLQLTHCSANSFECIKKIIVNLHVMTASVKNGYVKP